MATMPFEMGIACRKSLMEIEAGHAPTRTHAWLYAQLILRDQHHRAVILIDQLTGYDADNPRMPAGVGKHQRRLAVGLKPRFNLLSGREQYAAFERFSFFVQLVDKTRQICRTVGRLGSEQLDREFCLP